MRYQRDQKLLVPYPPCCASSTHPQGTATQQSDSHERDDPLDCRRDRLCLQLLVARHAARRRRGVPQRRQARCALQKRSRIHQSGITGHKRIHRARGYCVDDTVNLSLFRSKARRRRNSTVHGTQAHACALMAAKSRRKLRKAAASFSEVAAAAPSTGAPANHRARAPCHRTLPTTAGITRSAMPSTRRPARLQQHTARGGKPDHARAASARRASAHSKPSRLSASVASRQLRLAMLTIT